MHINMLFFVNLLLTKVTDDANTIKELRPKAVGSNKMGMIQFAGNILNMNKNHSGSLLNIQGSHLESCSPNQRNYKWGLSICVLEKLS